MQQTVGFAEQAASLIGEEKICIKLVDGAGHADKKFTEPETVESILSFLAKHLKP